MHWWKWYCVFVCADSSRVVMWFESQNRIAHICWSPPRGKVNKAFIHGHCHCSEGENCSHGFPGYLPHCHLTLCFHFSPSFSPLPTWFLPTLSLKEWISNITTGHHWHGARNWDDQTLWACQQVCQQHQQTTGCSGGEWGENETGTLLNDF